MHPLPTPRSQGVPELPHEKLSREGGGCLGSASCSQTWRQQTTAATDDSSQSHGAGALRPIPRQVNASRKLYFPLSANTEHLPLASGAPDCPLCTWVSSFPSPPYSSLPVCAHQLTEKASPELLLALCCSSQPAASMSPDGSSRIHDSLQQSLENIFGPRSAMSAPPAPCSNWSISCN